MSDDAFMERVRAIIGRHGRALRGLAHYDGCDRCLESDPETIDCPELIRILSGDAGGPNAD